MSFNRVTIELVDIREYNLKMRYCNGLRGRQLYVPLNDKEWEMFNKMIKAYKMTKTEFFRKVLLSMIKKHALLEREKGEKEKK